MQWANFKILTLQFGFQHILPSVIWSARACNQTENARQCEAEEKGLAREGAVRHTEVGAVSSPSGSDTRVLSSGQRDQGTRVWWDGTDETYLVTRSRVSSRCQIVSHREKSRPLGGKFYGHVCDATFIIFSKTHTSPFMDVKQGKSGHSLAGLSRKKRKQIEPPFNAALSDEIIIHRGF